MAEALRGGGRGMAPSPAKRSSPRSGMSRKAGYVAAALVSVGVLWVANHLAGWEWPPFLTNAFEDLLPWINVSLTATIAVDLLWAWRDPAWFKQLAQIGLDIISGVVIVRTWQIFPFDFTGYWPGWETVVRIAVGVAFVGVVVDTVTRLVDVSREALDHFENVRARGTAGQGDRLP